MTNIQEIRQRAEKFGLYESKFEHDACGLGFVASVKGIPSHEIVQQALMILQNLDHRGAVGADPLLGDGAGILIQIPDQFFRTEMAKQNILLPQPGDYGVGMIFLLENMLPAEPVNKKSKEPLKPKDKFFSDGEMCRLTKISNSPKPSAKLLPLSDKSLSGAVQMSWCRMLSKESSTLSASSPAIKSKP